MLLRFTLKFYLYNQLILLNVPDSMVTHFLAILLCYYSIRTISQCIYLATISTVFKFKKIKRCLRLCIGFSFLVDFNGCFLLPQGTQGPGTSVIGECPPDTTTLAW